MNRFDRSPIGLRGLILILVLLAVFATLCNSLIVAYGVQRDALVHSALEANRAYAFKVASSIDEFLFSVHERLLYSSQILGSNFENPEVLREETMRLQAQDSELNAVMIIDTLGKIVQIHPPMPQVAEPNVKSREMMQALTAKRPMVSPAYMASSGNLIVFVSQPILDPTGQLLGIVGGSVYIQQPGVMHTLIGKHQLDGTFAFVTDDNRRLLYHPDPKKIGETLHSSETVDAALRGENGAREVFNAEGVEMLAGYAQVTNAHWAVVAQQTREGALAPLSKLMRDMIIKIIPAGLIGLLLMLVGAMLITRPLRQLAKNATQLSEPGTTERLHAIKAWYAEAAAIRSAFIAGVQLLQLKIGSLNLAAESDPLTGLANRRAMTAALGALDKSGQQYAALALDIDHFKRVNDTFGHDAGDVALQHIAHLISDHSREGDLACRAGGEEFCLLLADTDLETAREIAERIRSSIALSPITDIGTLTISIGVACREEDAPSSETILKRADERLYLAKNGGRNRVVAQD
jgi:diguanylate cyclase (GGDEF)-like protein